MTFTAERASVNQRVQIGIESTAALGTAVTTGMKLIECYDWTFSIMADVLMYRATGHKYDTVQEENEEWSEGTIAGTLDYNGVIYPLAGVCGSVAPVAHTGSSVAFDWSFAPPTTGSIVPQTYTFQQGDAIRAHQTSYSLFTEFAYKGTRKDFSISGKWIGQVLKDAATLGSSPTAVALAPVVAKQVNVYLDPTSGALGTTILNRVLSIDFSHTGTYGPLWMLSRTNASWVAHVDLAPKAALKILLEADANGMAFLSYLQSGTTYYVRVNAVGNLIDNLQTVTLGSPSAGTFTLTYKAQTTTAIAYNATAATVQAALIALSTIGAGNVVVTGSAGGPYTVDFGGTLSQDVTALTGSGVGLTGGTFSIAQSQVFNTFNHDMAIKVGKPAPFKDDQGVYAIEWELNIVEDPTWGHAQLFTVTNLLASL